MVIVGGVDGWFPDPVERFDLRYRKDDRWTSWVSSAGAQSREPDFDAEFFNRRLTRLRKLKYLGSHERFSGQVEGIDVEFTRAGVALMGKKSLLAEVPWRYVRDLAADDRESVERRITAPRLLLLGAFALIAKKERTLSYLVVRDQDGEWIFEVPGISAIELRSGLVPLHRYVPMYEAPPNADQDPASRLGRLADLLASGILTQAEHDEQRAAIITSL